jgi:hypothetical protein
MTLDEFNDHIAYEVKTTVELLSKMYGVPITVAGGAEGRVAFSGPMRGVFSGRVTWEFDGDAVPQMPAGTQG